jgi:hypothetical protein
VGVIRSEAYFDEEALDRFLAEITRIRDGATWDKPEIVSLFNSMIPNFDHMETGRYLDGRM